MECTDYTLPPGQIERRAIKVCPYMERVEQQLIDGHERMDRIETAQKANNEDTAEILDIMRLGKSFFRMAGYFGAFVKWGGSILASVLAAWFAWKSGGKP